MNPGVALKVGRDSRDYDEIAPYGCDRSSGRHSDELLGSADDPLLKPTPRLIRFRLKVGSTRDEAERHSNGLIVREASPFTLGLHLGLGSARCEDGTVAFRHCGLFLQSHIAIL